MSQTVNSGNTSITGNASVAISNNKAITFINAQQVNAGTATVGTVGAGKRWIIVSMVLNSTAGTSSGSVDKILLNDVEALRNTTYTGATVPAMSNIISNFSYGSAPILAAGQTVKVVCATAGCQAQATVGYIEETV
jgi:hypothetical protein